METVEITMKEIERRARAYAEDQRALRFLLDALNAELEDAKRRSMKSIRRAVERAKTSRSELSAALEARKDLFVKPRTVVVDGIKVGWQKQKGTLSYEDAEQVCKLIRRHLPDMAEALIVVSERPVKDALAALPASDLRRIGVTLTNDTDVVVIKDTSGDIDKLVDALLREDTE